MVIQLWTAKYVPPSVPDFVDPHITVDDEDGFIFEVNSSHELFKKSKDVKKSVKTYLRIAGFTGVNFICEDEKPEHLHSHAHQHF